MPTWAKSFQRQTTMANASMPGLHGLPWLPLPYRWLGILKQFFVCIQIAMLVKSSKENFPQDAYANRQKREGGRERGERLKEGDESKKLCHTFACCQLFTHSKCCSGSALPSLAAIKMLKSLATTTRRTTTKNKHFVSCINFVGLVNVVAVVAAAWFADSLIKERQKSVAKGATPAKQRCLDKYVHYLWKSR